MPKVLCVKREPTDLANSPWPFPESVEITEADSLETAIRMLETESFDAIYWHDESDAFCKALQSSAVLDAMPDGVALLNHKNEIIQANKRLVSWFGNKPLIGLNFYQAIGDPNIVGSEPSPLATSLAKQTMISATLQVEDKFFDLNVAPIVGPGALGIQDAAVDCDYA